jgi:regulator of replication initiation timing
MQQELQSTKDVVVKQAEELQKLKVELESVRRQLAEKDAAASKAKPKAAPRKADGDTLTTNENRHWVPGRRSGCARTSFAS